MTNSIAVTPETLPAIMWQNKPVITTELLADIYGTAVNNIKNNFNNNKARFIEGVHYFLLKGADLKVFKSQVNDIDLALIHKFTTSLYLWTERGTVRHAKILDTDNAWAVQDRLEDFYFSKHQPKPYGLKELPPTPTSALDIFKQFETQYAAFKKYDKTVDMLPHRKAHLDTRIDELAKSQIGVSREDIIKNLGYIRYRANYKYHAACEFLQLEPIESRKLEQMDFLHWLGLNDCECLHQLVTDKHIIISANGETVTLNFQEKFSRYMVANLDNVVIISKVSKNDIYGSRENVIRDLQEAGFIA